jgi:hypothetical protein
MLRRGVLPITIVCSVLSACTLDSRKQAVEDVVQFGLSSPFTLLTIDPGHPASLAVADGALDAYNRIFDYLPRSDDIDSARTYYDRWMHLILSEATFSDVENVDYEIAADTLIARVAVRRPELAGFDETVLSRLPMLDSETLARRIHRAKHELQIRDTLVLRVVAGPSIVGWSSALRRRDTLALAARTEREGRAPPLPAGPVPASRPSAAPPAAVAAAPYDEDDDLPPLVDPADSTVTMWVNVGNANIRSGPGMEHEVVTVVTRGTLLLADSLADRWYRVREAEAKVSGFIAGFLVSTDTVAPPPPSPTPAPQRNDKGAIATEG